MKRAFLIANIIAATINGDPMKLVHKETGRVIAEVKDDAVIFYSRFLEGLLIEEGIFIPPLVRAQFESKEIIFRDDPLFRKAFIDVYCRFEMPSSLYEWKD